MLIVHNVIGDDKAELRLIKCYQVQYNTSLSRGLRVYRVVGHALCPCLSPKSMTRHSGHSCVSIEHSGSLDSDRNTIVRIPQPVNRVDQCTGKNAGEQ